jgi:hypothetical protein
MTMNTHVMATPRLASVRPLVRYVDENQAVIDIHLTLLPPLPSPDDTAPPLGAADVFVEVSGSDGFFDEQRGRVSFHDNAGSVRMEVVRPERWWPAGMGGQSLYTFRVSLIEGGEVADQRSVTVGFTSVRMEDRRQYPRRTELLVNSRICRIDSVVPIDLIHERRLLPVAGHSLLMVRDHYGPDVLYEAADRAGILLIQCVPIDPGGKPEDGVDDQVDRLSPHPSLAGWFVGHLGRMTEDVADRIHRLDPTRSVLRTAPERT